MIPGAEHAPIIAIIGGRYQQPSEAVEQHFRSAEAILHGVNLKTMNGHVRRLSCSDPDDMRAIWSRAAAVVLGATEEEALGALLTYDPSDGADQWSLFSGIDYRTYALEGGCLLSGLRGVDLKHATGALCRAVWGPK